MKLISGLYELLITSELRDGLVASDWVADSEALGEDVAPDLLARHLYEAVRRAFNGIRGDGRQERQLELANEIVSLLASTVPKEVGLGDRVSPEVLLSLMTTAEAGLGEGKLARPGIPLRHSELIVNGPRDLRVGVEISRELLSADRVDLLMSFVKWSGFVELREAIASFCARGRLRLLTTTYMGATDVEALEALAELGAEIKVSYDERRTRLHAKAWLFHRATGFSTGIVGSSNLSNAALRDGCEWNVRLSQRDNPPLLAKFRTTFEQYWNDRGFETYERDRFLASTKRKRDPGRDALIHLVRLSPLPHQSAVLDALETERKAGHFRNLVVAATGTGKTVIAALDYARQPGRPSLLFVAHRDRILEQSMATFRLAVRDGSFGEKLTGREKPVVGTHVFASVQSLHQKRLRGLDPKAFDVVIVDEFHHAAAPTYEAVLEHLRPRILLGLTATPERMDGRSVLGWFDDRIATESRLWDALDQSLLVPFQYFVVDDGTDLSQIDFRAGRYDVRSLETLYTADEHRARQVLRKLTEKVRNPKKMRAIGFCVSVRHAEFMAAFFNQNGLSADVVHGGTSPAEREARIGALERGERCCIFTVDVFNEGVDIPRIDTVLFLRPTESATVFVQQLGRGLRLHDEKACLTVLDFVGNAHQDFRFDLRFRALLGGGTRAEVTRAVEEGFPRLPSGCSIQLEKRSQDTILRNLRRTLKRWTALATDLEAGMSLANFLRRADLQPEELYRERKSFTKLKRARGLVDEFEESSMFRALPRLLHVDDVDRLTTWWTWLAEAKPPAADSADAVQRMFFAALGQEKRPIREMERFLSELWRDELLRDELRQLTEVLDDRRRHATLALSAFPLRVHAHYSRAEISAALGLVTKSGKLLSTQTGVYRCEAHRCDLLFVTLEKDEKDFTPTTLYEDYPISPELFHWESQSATREGSETGRRYRRPPVGWRIMLFVRQTKRDARRVTSAFMFLGPVKYVTHESERPMRITWKLQYAMPGDWFQHVKIAAG
jgi:superfamily II DNA or RNA helicase